MRQMSHFDFLAAIHPRRRPTSITGPDYLNHVAHLITFVLRKAKEKSTRLYSTFADSVFQADDVSRVRDRIVTFNYDDLLDRHILAKFPLQEVYFDRIKTSQDETSRRRQQFDHPLMVKLHGSVSWRCKTNDFKRIIDSRHRTTTQDHFMDIWHTPTGCPRPSDSVSPLLIPPLPAKPITELGIFRFLWTKAYEYLHEASQIIVCGYSLPATDQLAYSMFSNFVNRSIDRVTIVDPDTQVLARWRQLLDRNNIEIREWAWHADFSRFVQTI